MRILVFNGAVVGVDEVPGERWSSYTAHFAQSNVFGPIDRDLVDYDIFILDSEMNSPRSGNDKNVEQQIVERVSAGGCLIWFAGPTSIPWMPVALKTRGAISGTRFTISEEENPVIDVLSKHAKQMRYRTQFEHGYQPLASAINEFPIALSVPYGTGRILVLPEFQNRARLVRDLLDYAIPKILPKLASAPAINVGEDEPKWIAEFPIAKAGTLTAEISALDDQIGELRESREEKDRERRELLQYQGLLWLEGTLLELLVQHALNLLGIPVQPKPAVDLALALDGGGELYMEIEGTTGPIQIRKGRQLLGYIADEDDPGAFRGAIIGNPFRRDHPSARPPEGSQVGLFSPQMESLAGKQGWPLLTTSQLFDWVTRHMAGDKKASGEARKALGV